MPDLKDGETLEMQGSANRPYVLKNIGGVFSCSCPAWRNQSMPIEKRTCKHLRTLRGDYAEKTRIGTVLPSKPKSNHVQVKAPPLLLAESWDGETNPTGYWMSEKLDGVRAFWDGKQFLSRQGNRFYAPSWFMVGLPLEPLDGELWIGRKKFQRTVSIVRRQDGSDLWNEVRFRVFDTPGDDGSFETRLKLIDLIMEINRPAFAQAHPHVICTDRGHLEEEMERIDSLGGEGLMLRQPGSIYTSGRSSTLLKVKRFHDAEAVVIDHEPGTGRHKGRLGALLVELANGIRFAVGTGLSDAERDNPPLIGTMIKFRYQELTDGGVPRFPSYVGLYLDGPTLPSIHSNEGELFMPGTSTKRRFEFIGGSSDKFWEITVNDNQVIVCFGRNGTSGQSETKTFQDGLSADKHAQKKIDEKLKKGYVEVK